MTVNPDTIPRYADPTWVELDDAEPLTGACWNCGHGIDVTIDGKVRELCVCERDLHGCGDVYETFPETRDCKDWVDA